MTKVSELGLRAKNASYGLAVLSAEEKNKALLTAADALLEQSGAILEANSKDCAAARANGMSEGMLDRLLLNEQRLESIAQGIRDVAALPDPVGRILDKIQRPNGLEITKISVPMGVIAMIYEARPNVTADAAALCFKAGSACILRTGKEAVNSGRAIALAMSSAMESAGAPKGSICFLDDTGREAANELMRMNRYVDVLIPRGGAGLIRSVVETATVPVIETGTGNCHIYVDQAADLDMAAEIVYNSKTSRISVCNAAESLLVHRRVASEFLPLVKAKLDEKNVQLVGCADTCKILGDNVAPATEDDYGREYLDYKMSIKIVDSVEEAVTHINRYSTGHSETIVTSDTAVADQFTAGVDSAVVYVNASTRFTDGGEFGFGAEIGISTQKLHARGPMGLNEICSYKYIVHGNGNVR